MAHRRRHIIACRRCISMYIYQTSRKIVDRPYTRTAKILVVMRPIALQSFGIPVGKHVQRAARFNIIAAVKPHPQGTLRVIVRFEQYAIIRMPGRIIQPLLCRFRHIEGIQLRRCLQIPVMHDGIVQHRLSGHCTAFHMDDLIHGNIFHIPVPVNRYRVYLQIRRTGILIVLLIIQIQAG